MGINFHQATATASLSVDAACTIFVSGTGAATNQRASIGFISGRFPLLVNDKIDSVVNSNQHDHWLPLACH